MLPEMLFAELRDGEGNSLMIPRRFVGMAHMEDSQMRTHGTRGTDSMSTMYRVHKRGPLNLGWNWNIVLHGGFILR